MLPDPIERMDARIEDLVHEQFAGVPIGKIRCYGCKKIVAVTDVDAADGLPDSPAYCFECLDGIAETIAHQTERQ